MAYDRPSPKLQSFLAKHYGLTQSVPQVESYIFLSRPTIEVIQLGTENVNVLLFLSFFFFLQALKQFGSRISHQSAIDLYSLFCLNIF